MPPADKTTPSRRNAAGGLQRFVPREPPPDPAAGRQAAPLAALLGEDPRFRFTLGEQRAYQEFRTRESHLVSLVDESPPGEGEFDVLTFLERDTPVGAVSFLVQVNPRRPPPRNGFGRIDIVIVPQAHRGIGVGRLLLLAVTTHLLRVHGHRLYSISCLAAHPAVAHTLESLSFRPDPNRSPHYVHEELRVDGATAARLADRLAGRTERAIQQVRYTLRQRARNG